jgi:hypothetical protein
MKAYLQSFNGIQDWGGQTGSRHPIMNVDCRGQEYPRCFNHIRKMHEIPGHKRCISLGEIVLRTA